MKVSNHAVGYREIIRRENELIGPSVKFFQMTIRTYRSLYRAHHCRSAYVFMLIEAMADAAVSGGMPRKQAYQFAAQSVLGSAKMVLETGMHPGELKDMVCSPAGTTIEGVRILEKSGFRSAVFEALQGSADKGKKM